MAATIDEVRDLMAQEHRMDPRRMVDCLKTMLRDDAPKPAPKVNDTPVETPEKKFFDKKASRKK